MSEIAPLREKRKVLSLGRESRNSARKEVRDPQLAGKPPKFIKRENAWFMVWCEGGGEPKRLYPPDEIHIAILHAQSLAAQTGNRFHVLRSWRAFEPVLE